MIYVVFTKYELKFYEKFSPKYFVDTKSFRNFAAYSI